LRWANTCCGHPAPGEAVTVAAARRLVEEVGIGGIALAEVGVYSYYAEDPASGRVEYEYDHVLIGDLPAGRDILPDPDEVADVRWVPLAELRAALTDDPRSYAPWLAGVAERLTAHLAALPTQPSAPVLPPAPPAASPSDGPAHPPRSAGEAPESSGGG
jgi:isopentenyl-diphosphate delta-isomerase